MKSPIQTFSDDLHEMAVEAGDHLKDAAEKTGQEARDALRCSSQALHKAVDRIKSEAHALKAGRVVTEARAHPVITATLVASLIGLVGLLVFARQSSR